MVDQDPVKCNGCNNEEETRELHSVEQNAAAVDTVNKHKVGLGEEEVRACNDSTWIIFVFGLVLRGIQVHSPTATGLEKPTRANRVEE